LKNALEKNNLSDAADANFDAKIFGFTAVGVTVAMFSVMGFSMPIIIFIVLVSYFVWRAVARTDTHQIRGIFEFYLAANEILRDDERRWYGFEIQDVITRGQQILEIMPDAPPLVYFALGALYHHAGDFQKAENHLAFLMENEKADERSRLTASTELRCYVRILRKLEREPAEAPQTSAAIRALERARRHRAAVLLQESREKLREALAAAKAKELSAVLPPKPLKPLLERLDEKEKAENAASAENGANTAVHLFADVPKTPETTTENGANSKSAQKKRATKKGRIQKSITEVLRDIYD
jgi:hypothetical protein